MAGRALGLGAARWGATVTALPAYARGRITRCGRAEPVHLAHTAEELGEVVARIRPRRSSAGDLLRRLAGAVWADDQPYGNPITFVDPIASWRGEARCTTTTPSTETCRGCSPRWRCLEFALANREPFGTWGGLSTMARERLLAEHGDDVVEALIAAWRAEHPEELAA